jgi:hypothetical protein
VSARLSYPPGSLQTTAATRWVGKLHHRSCCSSQYMRTESGANQCLSLPIMCVGPFGLPFICSSLLPPCSRCLRVDCSRHAISGPSSRLRSAMPDWRSWVCGSALPRASVTSPSRLTSVGAAVASSGYEIGAFQQPVVGNGVRRTVPVTVKNVNKVFAIYTNSEAWTRLSLA